MITLIVLGWLSVYFILSITIVISRSMYLSSFLEREISSLNSMLMGAKSVRNDSILKQCSSGALSDASFLNVCLKMAEKDASIGLSWLAIISSTSPFIGLFGTVVSILDTFSGLGSSSSASLGIIAPAISEALVATASGIFVAIPAYTFHTIIRRKGYELINAISRQIDVLMANEMKNQQNNQEAHDRLE